MNTLEQLLTELENQLGFAEQVRLSEAKRIAAINQALSIEYNQLLSGTSLLKKVTTLTVASSTATPPTDFNEGTVLYCGDTSTFDASDEVYEVDEQTFNRWEDEDVDFMVQRYNTTTGDLEFHFQGVGSGTLYFEYERGAPILSNTSDLDGLPKKTKYATAKLAAGILTDNLLSDSTRMQVFLYGPSGNARNYSPDSIMGILHGAIKKRSIGRQSGKISQISLITK